MRGIWNNLKERAEKTNRSTYGNSHFWSIILIISFVVFMLGQNKGNNTSIAFGILGCILSGAMMIVTRLAQEKEATSDLDGGGGGGGDGGG